MRFSILTGIVLILTGCAVPGRVGRPAVVADDAFLEQYARTRRFSIGKPRAIRLVPDGSAVLFLRSSADSPVQDLYTLDTATGKDRVLLTADAILRGAQEQLSVEERARRERMRLSARGIAGYTLSKDGTRVLVPLSGRLFVIERESGRITELESEHGYPTDARFSPDGRYVSCVRDSELYVIDVATGEERRITTGAGGNITNARAEFVAQEEMGRRTGYWWSPDSRTIVYQQTDTTGLEVMHIMDATHPERPPNTWPYPRPGKRNADVRLGLISVDGGETTWVTWAVGDYPYLATVRWSENAPLCILVQNRAQTDEALLTVDPATGYTDTLLTEHDDAWINLDQKMPHWFPDGGAFLWTTERNGAWQLELRSPSGQLLAPVTGTDFGFRSFISLDANPPVARGDIGGFHATVFVSGGDDPTQTHVFRIALDVGAARAPRAANFSSRGRGLPQDANFSSSGPSPAAESPVQITSEPGVHGMTFSEDHSVYLHSVATLAGRSSRTLHHRDGTRIAALESVGAKPPFTPRIELTTVRTPLNPPLVRGDGPVAHPPSARGDSPLVHPPLPRGDRGGFHAVLVRPRNFNDDYRYPVIVYVYGGPHGQMVRASPDRYLLQQWIADHGFIVVAIDGRGTPARGRAWERVTKNNLIDIPLADQVNALRALGERYTELDLDRVGIYGWSFGGYFSAMAAMRRPDVYRAAVAGAPVADWMDYDTHYTERYMGLPEENPDGYRDASVLTYCKDLEVPLLIIHGTADDNVYFMHSLKMSDALFRAGRHHELLVLSDFTHMVRDPLVTTRLYSRIVSFFEEQLLK